MDEFHSRSFIGPHEPCSTHSLKSHSQPAERPHLFLLAFLPVFARFACVARFARFSRLACVARFARFPALPALPAALPAVFLATALELAQSITLAHLPCATMSIQAFFSGQT
jgi:hypothetical protein